MTCALILIWMVYGGWRGYHHLIVEPWTSLLVNLAPEAKQGTGRKLDRGMKFAVEVAATVYTKSDTCKGALGRVESHNREQKTTAGSTRGAATGGVQKEGHEA